jgi:hypothetical protein
LDNHVVLVGFSVHRDGAECGVFYLHGQILVPSQLAFLPCRLGVDQHSRIEQALRTYGCFGGLESGGEQRWALTIIPRSVVAPDRIMVSYCAAIRDHDIEAS